MDIINDSIIDDVRAVLATDPRLPAAEEIAVDAFDGTVTLRGTVGSFAQQRAAVADARRASGGAVFFDDLNVRLLGDDRRNDAEIRGAALQRLIWDSLSPGTDLDVGVADGWVTLKGEVEFQFQSDLAFDDVAGLYGVIGVTNEVKVVEIV